MSDLVWASALSPQQPFIPDARHWSAGVVATLALTFAASTWYATQDHAVVPLEEIEEEERVVVALGGSAPRRIEAPPPAPANAPISDTPYIVGERAKDAPPIAPPPEPRPVMQWTQGEGGNFSSGTGGTAQETSPPPPPPAAPKPKPEGPVGLGGKFAEISTVRFAGLIEYPTASLREGEEGLGILAVVINRKGRVQKWWLEKSTGWDRLDREIKRVAATVKRLDPLPRDFPGNSAVVRIPINFKIEDDFE